MNPFTKSWFWLLILGLIGVILAFVFFELVKNNSPGWVALALSVIFFAIAIILCMADLSVYNEVSDKEYILYVEERPALNPNIEERPMLNPFL